MVHVANDLHLEGVDMRHHGFQAAIGIVLGVAVFASSRAAEPKPVTAEDAGNAARVAIRAFAKAAPAAAARLTELEAKRDKAAVALTLRYANGADDAEAAFRCAWKEKPAELECAALNKLEDALAPKADDRPARPGATRWDGRQREMTAEDCGTAAATAVTTLRRWSDEAADALVRYTLERSKYSAHVKLVYLVAGHERTKAFHCHWHAHGRALEIDCH
jgi:hypothetical protein